MSKTDAINTGVPPDTGESPALGAARIRALARGVIELIAVNHRTGASSPYNEDYAGEHSLLTLYKASTPETDTDKGFVYAKDVGSGVIELFYKDASDHEIQITEDGKIRSRSADNILANNIYLQARNKADDGNVNLIKAGRNEADDADVAVLSDALRTETDAAPAEDTGIANKKFVNDQITTGLATKANANPFGAWESKANNTEYTALTDGIVCASGQGYNTIFGYTPVATLRLEGCTYGTDGGLTMPVRKGDTWKVVGATASVYWLSIGS